MLLATRKPYLDDLPKNADCTRFFNRLPLIAWAYYR